MTKYWLRGIVIAALIGFLIYVANFKYVGVSKYFMLPTDITLLNESGYAVLNAKGDTISLERLQVYESKPYIYYEIRNTDAKTGRLLSGMRLVTDSLYRPVWSQLEKFKIGGTSKAGKDSLTSDSYYLYFQKELVRAMAVINGEELEESKIELTDPFVVDFGFQSAWNTQILPGAGQLITVDTTLFTIAQTNITTNHFPTEDQTSEFFIAGPEYSLKLVRRMVSKTFSSIDNSQSGYNLFRKYSQNFSYNDLDELKIPKPDSLPKKRGLGKDI